jgi:hypothetical protein
MIIIIHLTTILLIILIAVMTAPLITIVPHHPEAAIHLEAAAAMAEEQVGAGKPNKLLFTSQFTDDKNYKTNQRYHSQHTYPNAGLKNTTDHFATR